MDYQNKPTPSDMMIISKHDVLRVVQSMLTTVESCLLSDNSTADDCSSKNDDATSSQAKLISTKEVLKILKISPPTLWRYGRPSMQESQYYLPHYKINGKNMYKRIDVERVYNLKFGNAL